MYFYGTWFVSLLVFLAFWIGVGTLVYWVSKTSVKEKNLLVIGLVLVAAALFLSSFGMLLSPMMGGYGDYAGIGADYGWMMRR